MNFKKLIGIIIVTLVIGIGPSLFIDACNFCELSDECDRLADDLNNIEYCMCLSDGCIKDTQYKVKHPKAYFKKVD